MTDTLTPENDADNEETRKQVSDARVILGPLVKYAAMGFVIVTIIVTTAVMLDHQLNTIDEEVAALQAQLERANRSNAAPEENDSGTSSAGNVSAVEAAVEPQAESIVHVKAQADDQVGSDVAVTQVVDEPGDNHVIAAPVATPPSLQAGDQNLATSDLAAQSTKAIPRVLRHARPGIKHHVQTAEKRPGQLRVAFQFGDEHVPARGHVEIPGAGNLTQIAQRLAELSRHRAAVVDVIGAAIGQNQIADLVPRRRMVPRPPV